MIAPFKPQIIAIGLGLDRRDHAQSAITQHQIQIIAFICIRIGYQLKP